MLKLGRVTKFKMLFLELVFVFNFDLFKFSAAILEKGLLKLSESILFRCRCQKSPRGIIAYQLLTPCSNDPDAQSRQSLQGFAFTVILRGFFSQLISYMAPTLLQ